MYLKKNGQRQFTTSFPKDDANRKLCQNLELREIDKDKFLRLEQDKYAVVVELECKKQELNEKNKELNKERQKLENSIRHEQVKYKWQKYFLACLFLPICIFCRA
jgi:hypothetical protein